MIRGHLFDDHYVSLCNETADYGGSWLPLPGEPLEAYGQGVLRLFYDRLVRHSARVVFDVGANTGSFSLLAALVPGLTIHAFEPVREMYDLLRQNIDANELGARVHAHRLALSDVSGQGEMTIPRNTRQSGLSFLDTRAPDMPCRSEMVPVQTLDEFCAAQGIPRVDAIKIDVEGIEAKVLQGGMQTIQRCAPMILLEATNTYQTLPILERWGYQCTDFGTDILAVKG